MDEKELGEERRRLETAAEQSSFVTYHPEGCLLPLAIAVGMMLLWVIR